MGDTLVIKKDGVGTFIVSVSKAATGIWLSLGADGERRGIWNDARVKYPKDMDAYFREIERASGTSTGSEELVI